MTDNTNKPKNNMVDVTESNIIGEFHNVERPGHAGVIREEPRDRIEIIGYERETAGTAYSLFDGSNALLLSVPVIFWAHVVYPDGEYPVVEPCFMIKGVTHAVRASELAKYNYRMSLR